MLVRRQLFFPSPPHICTLGLVESACVFNGESRESCCQTPLMVAYYFGNSTCRILLFSDLKGRSKLFTPFIKSKCLFRLPSLPYRRFVKLYKRSFWWRGIQIMFFLEQQISPYPPSSFLWLTSTASQRSFLMSSLIPFSDRDSNSPPDWDLWFRYLGTPNFLRV